MTERAEVGAETAGPSWHAPMWVIAGEYPFPPGHFRRCTVCEVREGWPSWHHFPPGQLT